MIKKNNLPTNKIQENIPSRPDYKWALKMFSILVWFIFITIISVFSFAYFVIGNISLEKEKQIFGDIILKFDNLKKFDKSLLNGIDNIEHDLYVKNSNQVNAFATLWGNIVFTDKLLEEIKYKEELLFIIWHEKHHIENRDPLKMVLINYPLKSILSYFWNESWLNISEFQNVISTYFSKQIEIKADNKWIEFVKKHWLNPWCIIHFFENKEDSALRKYMEFVSSHPTTDSRIENIKQQTDKNLKEKKCTNFVRFNK